MIFIPEINWAFCHIPRTGGTALTVMIQRAFPLAISHAEPEVVHQSAAKIRQKYPNARVFAVMRNPWKIWESNYGWVRRFGHLHNLDSDMTWNQYFERFLKVGWPCKNPGFYKTFVDDKTWVFKYEANPLPLIEEMLGRELILQIYNTTRNKRPSWTQRQIDLIGDRCIDDIDRFGYTPHPDMIRV
jgi:hypothetical protein